MSNPIPPRHKSQEEFANSRAQKLANQREYAQWRLFFNLTITEMVKRVEQVDPDEKTPSAANLAISVANRCISSLKEQAAILGVEPFPED